MPRVKWFDFFFWKPVSNSVLTKEISKLKKIALVTFFESNYQLIAAILELNSSCFFNPTQRGKKNSDTCLFFSYTWQFFFYTWQFFLLRIEKKFQENFFSRGNSMSTPSEPNPSNNSQHIGLLKGKMMECCPSNSGSSILRLLEFKVIPLNRFFFSTRSKKKYLHAWQLFLSKKSLYQF